MTAPLTRSGRPNMSGTRGGQAPQSPFPVAEEAYSRDNEQKFRSQLRDTLQPLREQVAGIAASLPQWFHLTEDGAPITTIGNFFGADSNIVLEPNAYYLIEIAMAFLNTTIGTVTWSLINEAAPTAQSVYYEQSPITGVHAPPGLADALFGYTIKDSTANLTYTTGSLSSAVDHLAKVKISLINGAGTFLRLRATKNVGGSITPRVGSFWTAQRLPANNIGTYAA